jgi:hypothetical protein
MFLMGHPALTEEQKPMFMELVNEASWLLMWSRVLIIERPLLWK